MSKIRTVKPELFRHEQLFEAEQNSSFPLRLIFIGLFTVVDAEGRFRWRPRQLKLDILPYDEFNFSAALSALVDYGFVHRYEHDGECYGYIPTWRKHQSINLREPESVLPDPQLCIAMRLPAALGKNYAPLVQRSEKNMPASVMHRPMSTSISGGEPIDLAGRHASTSTSSTSSLPTAEPAHDVASVVAAELGTCMPMPNSATPMCDSVLPIPDRVAPMLASLEMEVEKELEVESEREGKRKWKKSKHPPPRAVQEPVEFVFEHWKVVMDHPKAVLDPQRRRMIQAALDKGYSVIDLCQAITGCSLTPHNRGRNDRGERYDGLQVILRSADQIERFIRNSLHPPKPLNKAEQRLHSNVQVAQNWLQQQRESGDGAE